MSEIQQQENQRKKTIYYVQKTSKRRFTLHYNVQKMSYEHP